MNIPAHCTLCPRRCGADRRKEKGKCGAGSKMKLARAALHMWEEPCISGEKGSGTVFFAGCALGCIFCQNHKISHGNFGREAGIEETAGIFLKLRQEGAHNLNLVTGSQYAPWIAEALEQARRQGLRIPVVWNTGGYESAATLEILQPHVDVWLTDLKFYSPQLAERVAGAPDYFEKASAAVVKMAEMAGPPRLDEGGMLRQGVLIRLLVLPGQRQDAKELLHWMAEHLPKDGFLLSLMWQYTPPPALGLEAPFDRRVASFEYKDVLDTAVRLGLTNGYTQGKGSAKQAYTPPFDLAGV